MIANCCFQKWSKRFSTAGTWPCPNLAASEKSHHKTLTWLY